MSDMTIDVLINVLLPRAIGIIINYNTFIYNIHLDIILK